MKTIILNKGLTTMVDDEDFEMLNKYKWNAVKDGSTHYATRIDYTSGKAKTIKMHREIMKTPIGLQTDHINGDGLYNCKSNLRIVTARQNSQNKHMNKTSEYVGVSWHKGDKKWQAHIHIKKLKYLGSFNSEIDAHNAYLKALSEIGEVFIDNLI